MKRLFGSMGVASCGLITSVFTAILVLVVQRLTGLNVFTMMVLMVLPAGAVATGMAAASGYYFGSLYFHMRPGLMLVLQMVLIAGFTQWLIYYLDYITLVLDDGRQASNYIDFYSFLDIILTKAQYTVGRAQTKTGELGEAGYWVAALQFVGFLVGGLACFAFLTERPTCQKCKKYYRPLAAIDKQFGEREHFISYYDGLFAIPVDTPLFSQALHEQPEKMKVVQGTITLRSSLLGCPECKQQMIADQVQVFNGHDWKEIRELGRKTLIPDGINLIPAFRDKGTKPMAA